MLNLKIFNINANLKHTSEANSMNNGVFTPFTLILDKHRKESSSVFHITYFCLSVITVQSVQSMLHKFINT